MALRFKTFLLEYLTDEQRQRYSHIQMSDKARTDTDHFFGVGNDKLHGEIKHEEKSEIHRQLENHLGYPISHEDYKRGIVKDKYNRDVKIGRLIKDNNLRNQFDKDPARLLDKAPSLKTTTVRGTEVAGQTNPTPNAEHPKGHTWKDFSCKNVEDGMNKHYLDNEIRHGTVVHFVHDHNGQEIYRATLQPHHNDAGHTAYSLDAEYGIKHPNFTADSHRIAKELSGEYKPGVFHKHPEVYNDNGRRQMHHPGITTEHIDRILHHGPDEDKHWVINHPSITPDHISHVLQHSQDDALRAAAMNRSDVITPAHVMMGLNDPSHAVRRIAIDKGTHITADHITRALEPDQPADIRRIAIRNNQVNHKHLAQVIQHDPDAGVVRSAVMHKDATPEHLHMALDHKHPAVREAVFDRSPERVNSSHIDRGVRDEDEHVVYAAARHGAAQPHHIDHVLEHGTTYAVSGALHQNSNATPEHLGKVIRSSDPKFKYAKELAVAHRNVSPQNISDAIKHGTEDVKYAAVTNNAHRLTDENIDDALTHFPKGSAARSVLSRVDNLSAHHITQLQNPDEDSTVRRRVLWHTNATPEHLSYALKHDPHTMVKSAVFDSPHVTPEHVWHAIHNYHDNDIIMRSALHSNGMRPEHVWHIAKHNDPADMYRIPSSFRRDALRHPDMPQEHLDRSVQIDKGNRTVRQAIAAHPKLKDEHITSMLNDPEEHYEVHNAIASRDDLKPHHVDALMTNKHIDDDTKMSMLHYDHPKVTAKHITHVLNNARSNNYLIVSALRHPAANKNHFNMMKDHPNDFVRHTANEKLKEAQS